MTDAIAAPRRMHWRQRWVLVVIAAFGIVFALLMYRVLTAAQRQAGEQRAGDCQMFQHVIFPSVQQTQALRTM